MLNPPHLILICAGIDSCVPPQRPGPYKRICAQALHAFDRRLSIRRIVTLLHSVLCYAPRASPAACDSLPAFCLPRTVVSMRSTLSHPVSLAQVPQRLHHRRQGCFERLPGRPAAAERRLGASERFLGREVRGAIFDGAGSTCGGRWLCSIARTGFKPRSWRLPTSTSNYTQPCRAVFGRSL